MIREKIYIGIIVALVIGMIILVVLTQEERKDMINVSQCSKPKGEYAVDAGYSSINTINTCGTNGTSVCTFNVSSLQNAFNICNTNSEKCNSFMYNEKAKSITFLGDKPSTIINPNSNIYTRQSLASVVDNTTSSSPITTSTSTPVITTSSTSSSTPVTVSTPVTTTSSSSSTATSSSGGGSY